MATAKLTKSQLRAIEIAKNNGGKLTQQKFVSYSTIIALRKKGVIEFVEYGVWKLAEAK